ncbi:D-glycero-beta-D-manno-heptose 1,7-bisphosphate 7-phosphatase [uncultured Aquincola sp.]|uniref:D-glycero-beta-D-manno-heptose 1,7-bisphosphate 7-phosphatase n=1 Tax=uncultured Aquincola sp. TaxID=886556 RepID=UPI0032B1B187
MTPPKLIILGRDGILNRFRDDHVKAPEEWAPIPGALDAVARLNHAGWHAVVATNQSGIGRGMIDMASLNAVHAHMMKLLSQHGGRIDAVFFCPHVPEDQCDCRKPLPGLMKQIGQRYGTSLAEVPMVCDNPRDLEAAHAAGCRPHLVRSGRAAELDDASLAEWLAVAPETLVHADLAALADHLLRGSGDGLDLDSGPMGLA